MIVIDRVVQIRLYLLLKLFLWLFFQLLLPFMCLFRVLLVILLGFLCGLEVVFSEVGGFVVFGIVWLNLFGWALLVDFDLILVFFVFNLNLILVVLNVILLFIVANWIKLVRLYLSFVSTLKLIDLRRNIELLRSYAQGIVWKITLIVCLVNPINIPIQVAVHLLTKLLLSRVLNKCWKSLILFQIVQI